MLDEKPLLTTGKENPLLPQLISAINKADQIEFAVAFIKSTGLNLIFDALVDAVERGAKVSVLTSDYLAVTDPSSLRSLMLLAERNARVKIYEARNTSFHLKTYIFSQNKEHNSTAAFIGSSNVSRAALETGIEWNYRVYSDDDSSEAAKTTINLIRNEYQKLFASTQSQVLTHRWIDEYEERYKLAPPAAIPGALELEEAPVPTQVQEQALAELKATREAGFTRGVVVMATGLGKTFLAAFDCIQAKAGKVLFLAHREEILIQAEKAFLRAWPKAKTGFYSGAGQDPIAAKELDVVCASIQTLSRENHLKNFAPDQFDYIVVDEFHHSTAPTYRRVINYFNPKFLLGLTATPERSDQSDILSLCDDNLVYSFGLFDAVSDEFLVPFSYYGIFDEHVNYEEIPWRNRSFDPELLSSKLASLGRAKHAYRVWQERRQSRTLAFCVSRSHADFMAEKFSEWGVKAASVHGDSSIKRGEGLELLRSGALEVIFSVDLFNEGVDLPEIDTVMMLRPTDSKIMFLQQLGRGLRKLDGKECLVVLDFIGNHQGFFNKTQALFGLGSNRRELSDFARSYEKSSIELPAGCFVNIDLEIIEFLKDLTSESVLDEYKSLCDSLGRRPTLSEYFRGGNSIRKTQAEFGSWWDLVSVAGDLSADELAVFDECKGFFTEVEATRINKSFKMITLEAMLELGGFETSPTLSVLAKKSREVLQRRPNFLTDVKESLHPVSECAEKSWLTYWRENPIKAWDGNFFKVEDDHFNSRIEVSNSSGAFEPMLQELVDYRLLEYSSRRSSPYSDPLPLRQRQGISLPFFPNLKIACGTFRPGKADYEEYKTLSAVQGNLDPARHFIAQASGNSMNGGKNPVLDGDYLLLEHITSDSAGSISNKTLVIERLNEFGEGEYLLRQIRKNTDGTYMLDASNPEYKPLQATEGLRPLARLVSVLNPLELELGSEFIREDIPPLFGEVFNTGNWQSGHVVLKEKKKHILLVTLSKQGKQADHRYLDYFGDEGRFHWQSQNSTADTGSRGKTIINHQSEGVELHLFVRENKLGPNGKAAPFTYHGRLSYQSHEGSKPMSVVFDLVDA